MITDFFLVMFHSSIVQAIIFSNTAMTVDNDAKAINRKNRAPQILPPVIDKKTLGKVIKIRLGPLSGFTPNEKHAGKMIRPATIATNVSNTATFTASPKRVLSFFK